MPRLRVLAMDHFFDQDLRALEAHPGLDVRRFPYQRLRNHALRLLGDDVARGLHAYNSAALGAARGRYAAWLAREVRRLYLERAFDVLVLPSDTFFYVRTLPAAAHRLGLPVVVVQKETTISEATMDVFSEEVKAQAPFVSDYMTVCSERQKAFWVRAGARAERIEVTGQPRFDIYASRRVSVPSSRRRVLFLSYALDAYVPGAGRGKGLRTWEPLRDATERTLIDLARAGSCEVVVKCHPQQDRRAEAARLAGLAGATWGRGVTVADQDADTRTLIIAADVVVGFQTTALYEAVAARRSVVYAAWGDGVRTPPRGIDPIRRGPRILRPPRRCSRGAARDAHGRSHAGDGVCAVVRGGARARRRQRHRPCCLPPHDGGRILERDQRTACARPAPAPVRDRAAGAVPGSRGLLDGGDPRRRYRRRAATGRDPAAAGPRGSDDRRGRASPISGGTDRGLTSRPPRRQAPLMSVAGAAGPCLTETPPLRVP